MIYSVIKTLILRKRICHITTIVSVNSLPSQKIHFGIYYVSWYASKSFLRQTRCLCKWYQDGWNAWTDIAQHFLSSGRTMSSVPRRGTTCGLDIRNRRNNSLLSINALQIQHFVSPLLEYSTFDLRFFLLQSCSFASVRLSKLFIYMCLLLSAKQLD